MPGLSEYQSVFRIEKNEPKSKAVEPRISKRNRQTVSCLACRTRKLVPLDIAKSIAHCPHRLKCDRQIPCSSCSKRGPSDAASCNYSSDKRSDRGKRYKSGDSKNAEAHVRLQQLEAMVTCLIHSTNASPENNSNNAYPSFEAGQALENLSLDGSLKTTEASSDSRGHLNVNDSSTKYVGATHWTSILDNIRGIQVALGPDSDEEDAKSPSSSLGYPDVLVDTNRSLTVTDVCNTLGPKTRVDKLISTYFNHKHNQNPIIHRKKFMREYESFWLDPSSVSFLWISMLFSALHIGTQVAEACADGEVDSLNRSLGEEFLKMAGQSLVAGRYDKARPYSIESLLLYTLCKHFQKGDQDTNTCLMMSVCARLSIQMGYHQDPRHLARCSPFEAEMRRRTFFTVEALDFLVSFQAGLPTSIPEEICDTEHPSNLFDTDFDEDCEKLPPSRPPTDPTPMLYYCYKSRLVRVSRHVLRYALAINRPSHEQTMILDAELQVIHTDVPPSLRPSPLASCFGDQPYTVLHRSNLELMYLKIICILHRHYINHERSNPAFDYSRKTCIGAALQMLKYQSEIHFACQPDGSLYNERWMPSHLLLYDYPLAVMVICLNLYELHQGVVTKSHEEQLAEIEQYDAVRQSYEIWSSRRAISRDARRASDVLAVLLSKLPRPSTVSTQLDTPPNTLRTSPGVTDRGNMNGVMATSPWGPNPDYTIPGHNSSIDNYTPLDFTLEDPLNNIFTGSNDIDWNDTCDLPPSNEA
ncbi:Fusarisetin A cluster transcription factor fsa6 [Lachnellula suecica]|uniref:Fusarisetin A cluster transcription factor fsa6 n=1 Tax=Lachnellula suecica TaxID=602035 RepID=A0A8T9CH22_9HELO|nr:Fusarisetin A cluster transcription factor fsa6 [Lachnellula suecica]